MTGGGSFEAFYTGSVGRLLGQLFLVTGDLHEAEEVVQEAFARASGALVVAAGLQRPRSLGASGGHEPGRRPGPQAAPPGPSDPAPGAAAWGL